MLANLIDPYYQQAERERTRRPIRANSASMLGGACERELVYARIAWEEARLPAVDLELVFREGRLQERAVLRDLEAAGIEVIEQQSTLEYKPAQITGHVDGVISVPGARGPMAVPLEIKSMSDHIWNSIAFRGPGVYVWAEVAPAFEKKPWLRRYFAQLQLYMLLKETPLAIMLCKNKTSGAIAQINAELDSEYGQALLDRADRINRHVAAGTMPDRIEYDPDVCGRCAWEHLCLPDAIGKPPVAVLSDGQIELKLERRSELAEDRAEYEHLDGEIKEWMRAQGMDAIAIGDWLLERKPFGKTMRITIKRVGGESEGEEDV